MSWSLLTPVTLAYGNFFSIQSAIFPINTIVFQYTKGTQCIDMYIIINVFDAQKLRVSYTNWLQNLDKQNELIAVIRVLVVLGA
jgi:hypothetical protein